MFIRWILPLSVTLGLGILIGRLSMDHDPSSASRGSDGRTASSPSGPSTGDTKPDRSRNRPALTPTKPENEKVTILLKDAEAALQGHYFTLMSFDNANQKIDTALALLGTTPAQREQIADLMNETRRNLIDLEQANFRVRGKDDHKVELDIGDFDEFGDAAEKEIDRMKQQFRDILPERTADALLNSISWQNYYPLMAPLSNYATLSITQLGDGHLMATFRAERSSQGKGFDSSKYPAGQPIPASEVFDERWRPYLKDVFLLPSVSK